MARADTRLRGWGRSALILPAMIVALALGCEAEPHSDTKVGRSDSAPAIAPFDILILVLDACRADRIGAYGYRRPTTPYLDSLASGPDAVVFERYYVEGSWTKPSTASLFTGLYIHQHGVRKAHDAAAGGRWTTQVLGSGYVTLAERLRARGFSTFGVVKSHHLVAEYGFDQGFDTYLGPGEVIGDINRVQAVIRLILESDEPFFGYLHLNACHHPFTKVERHPKYMEAFGRAYPEARRVAEGVDFSKSAMKRAINEEGLELDRPDVRFLSLIYDAQLHAVDSFMVAPIVGALEASGRWDRTLLLVTADHGEELYEHRGYAHGHALWNEVIHVPLIAKFPAGRRPPGLPDRVTEEVSNIDLYPSILALLGEAPTDRLPGRPVLEDPSPGFAFSQLDESWSVVARQQKLYVRNGDPQLFDLHQDPDERHDLAATQPERVAELFEIGQSVLALEALVDGGTQEIEVELDDQALENLRALGYIEE